MKRGRRHRSTPVGPHGPAGHRPVTLSPDPGEDKEGAPHRAGRGRERVQGGETPHSGAIPPSPTLPRKGEEGRAAPDLVVLGEFGRAHGLKGEVRVKSFTGDPMAIATYGPLLAGGRPVVLRSVRPAPGAAPDVLIAAVDGVTSREAAEALNRLELRLPRQKLPPPEEDEFLLADLIGLGVETPAGERLGTVVAVPNYGGGDLVEIAPEGGGATAHLPFTKAFVPVIDLPGGRLVVDAPADLFAPVKPGPEERP